MKGTAECCIFVEKNKMTLSAKADFLCGAFFTQAVIFFVFMTKI